MPNASYRAFLMAKNRLDLNWRWRRNWLFLMGRVPADVRIGWNVRFGGRNISIGARTEIEDYALLATRDWNGDQITLGERCSIRSGVQLHSWGGFINIGNNCSINPYSVFYGKGGITIGNDVRIAAHVTMMASSHIFERVDVPIISQGQTVKGIWIEDDVWIGAGVRVLDGVRVGRGSVLAAGAVVNRDVAPFSVVGGVPARLLKNRIQPSAEDASYEG